MKNPDNVPPELFEVQSGRHLDEDDIVWFKRSVQPCLT
ncbi:hypothetical protein [Xanthomonas hortorum]|nr:hypothetical protein [Xanthomonas hortorum]MCC8496957.1 hypothetical protein [Xanthomonas hortorum pv. gardneri]MCC8507352.1 hypothetical protein [Xanthomonas hortorum pv. gardneri]MCC8510262.1 hypothetical protein [Xanthomonas hortorum pv. gardneri]MCC8520823.1 hypothetical protein [Xanthomonas hortorum pv. gardneri]MCC8523264.1 hypothetical protein [Xanthomonas hortorum pv. gardneri]